MSGGHLTLALFLIFQVTDGLLTYAAVTIFGTIAEGNPLLVTWMGIAGAGPALLGAKLLASGCGVILHIFGLHRVLAGLTAFYLVGAVAPWLHVFSW
jgi:hypothetical protein